MTLTQKILAHHARRLTRPWVEAGDILQIAVDWTPLATAINEIGRRR
jgi:aconitate hydratase/homoaconitate hydratase